MSAVVLGAILGAAAGVGAWLTATRVLAISRGNFEARVLSYLSDMPTTREGRADHNGYSAELRTATSTAWRLMGQLARMRDRLRKPPLDPEAPGGR